MGSDGEVPLVADDVPFPAVKGAGEERKAAATLRIGGSFHRRFAHGNFE
jgi:hypothetical protein